MDTATRVQDLNEAVYISHGVSTLRKGMNLTFLPPAMSQRAKETGFFNLCLATGQEGKL